METSVCCIRLLTHPFSWRFQSNLRYWQWEKFGDWWKGRGSRTNSIHWQWFSGSIQKPRRGRRAPQSRGACRYKAVVSRQSDDNWTADGVIEERGNTTCCCLRQKSERGVGLYQDVRNILEFYGSQLEYKTSWDGRLTMFMVEFSKVWKPWNIRFWYYSVASQKPRNISRLAVRYRKEDKEVSCYPPGFIGLLNNRGKVYPINNKVIPNHPWDMCLSKALVILANRVSEK